MNNLIEIQPLGQPTEPNPESEISMQYTCNDKKLQTKTTSDTNRNTRSSKPYAALSQLKELENSIDMFLLQEHWLYDCQLLLLNEISDKLSGVGKAVDSLDPIPAIQMPRGYGGTAILWKKRFGLNNFTISNSKLTIETIEDVTKAFQNLNDIIVNSTKAADPAIKMGEKRHKLQVMNDAIKEAIKKKKLAFQDWKINGRPKESDKCRLEVAKRRINERQKLINARTSDRNMFYKIIKNQRGKLSRIIDQLNVDDNTYHNENIIKGWRSHFHNLAKKEPNQNYDTKYLDLIEKEAKIIIDICKDRFKHNPITEEEISKAISSFNRNKAADYFGINAENVIHGGKQLQQYL
ncbi:unnamed protein product [Mytilus coruscus]|uniref:Uncharacterized protein n=1 Tax=Mytilus coruscus TaxID=42192 RepID=A0A6J8EBM6_MYTCO|nr:unnamed protein product [Mytilus coruscus]